MSSTSRSRHINRQNTDGLFQLGDGGLEVFLQGLYFGSLGQGQGTLDALLSEVLLGQTPGALHALQGLLVLPLPVVDLAHEEQVVDQEQVDHLDELVGD